MIKRLQRRMLLTIMSIVTAVLVVFVMIVVLVPAEQTRNDARTFLEQAAARLQEDSMLERPRDDEDALPDTNAFVMANMFYARLNPAGDVVYSHSDRSDLYDEAYIAATVTQIARLDKEFGVYDDCYYLVQQRRDETLVILLDHTEAFRSSRGMAFVAVFAAAGMWGLLLLLSIVIVRRMTDPVQEAFDRQRRFISDAGHELKTPIAVISANSNVLQEEIGENRWLSYIQSEAGRMQVLVKELMTLAEIDQIDRVVEHKSFNASQAVMRSVLPFESMAFEKGMTINTYVQPDVMMVGREDQLCQLIGIFINNAIRYGADNGEIRVLLAKARKKITLSVYNTGVGVAEAERAKIFDRFYRVDKARSRSGGNYGLGLAIAKAILDEHEAQIAVEGEYGSWVRFVMTFNG